MTTDEEETPEIGFCLTCHQIQLPEDSMWTNSQLEYAARRGQNEGAAIAFGIIGMAEAIRETQKYYALVRWIESLPNRVKDEAGIRRPETATPHATDTKENGR